MSYPQPRFLFPQVARARDGGRTRTAREGQRGLSRKFAYSTGSRSPASSPLSRLFVILRPSGVYVWGAVLGRPVHLRCTLSALRDGQVVGREIERVVLSEGLLGVEADIPNSLGPSSNRWTG